VSIKVEGNLRHSTTHRLITTIERSQSGPEATSSTRRSKSDEVLTEEPLEIRINDQSSDPFRLATIMRTPGNDFDLAIGYLISEGVIKEKSHLANVCYCNLVESEEQRYNVVTVTLRTSKVIERNRSTPISSACGICGTTTLDDIFQDESPLPKTVSVDSSIVFELPDSLRKRQKLFHKTGSAHAAGIFNLKGEALLVREDVGRHNALDKAIGASLVKDQFPLKDKIAVLSGRIALELIQKALMAKVEIVVAVGAPSSLALDLADRANLTVVGFTSMRRFNIYSHPERII
ncbi:unnamed protein product, partial [Acidithrix sp. C25]